MPKVIQDKLVVEGDGKEAFRIIINNDYPAIEQTIQKLLKKGGFAGNPKERIKTASGVVLIY